MVKRTRSRTRYVAFAGGALWVVSSSRHHCSSNALRTSATTLMLVNRKCFRGTNWSGGVTRLPCRNRMTRVRVERGASQRWRVSLSDEAKKEAEKHLTSNETSQRLEESTRNGHVTEQTSIRTSGGFSPKAQRLLIYLAISTTIILGLIPLSLYVGPPLTGAGFADPKLKYLDSAPTIAFLVGYLGFIFVDRSLARPLMVILGISAVLSTISVKISELKLLKADNETAFLVFTIPLGVYFAIQTLWNDGPRQDSDSLGSPSDTKGSEEDHEA